MYLGDVIAGDAGRCTVSPADFADEVANEALEMAAFKDFATKAAGTVSLGSSGQGSVAKRQFPGTEYITSSNEVVRHWLPRFSTFLSVCPAHNG